MSVFALPIEIAYELVPTTSLEILQIDAVLNSL